MARHVTSTNRVHSSARRYKTSLKTTTNDDERFAEFVSILEAAERELTGKCARGDGAKWAELATLLAEELRQGESKTSISSVPAFLAEHLRRRLRKEVKGKREGKRPPTVEVPQQPEQDPDRRPTPEEISSFAATVTDLLKDGATLEEVTAQFAGSLHPGDWEAIRSAAMGQTKER